MTAPVAIIAAALVVGVAALFVLAVIFEDNDEGDDWP